VQTNDPNHGRQTRRIRIDGAVWLIYEFTSKNPATHSTSLVFECAGTMRRIRQFPSDWLTMDGDILFDLSRRP
jgi:hypothetical protein